MRTNSEWRLIMMQIRRIASRSQNFGKKSSNQCHIYHVSFFLFLSSFRLDFLLQRKMVRHLLFSNKDLRKSEVTRNERRLKYQEHLLNSKIQRNALVITVHNSWWINSSSLHPLHKSVIRNHQHRVNWIKSFSSHQMPVTSCWMQK